MEKNIYYNNNNRSALAGRGLEIANAVFVLGHSRLRQQHAQVPQKCNFQQIMRRLIGYNSNCLGSPSGCHKPGWVLGHRGAPERKTHPPPTRPGANRSGTPTAALTNKKKKGDEVADDEIMMQ
jgi:hypothetical protein